MSNKSTAAARANQAKAISNESGDGRTSLGRFAPGVSGNPTGAAGLARRALNRDTILAMHEAFRAGGREAIDKVMKSRPDIFLKLLVLLVPRELEVTHSGSVKQMTDEQIEQAIEAIQEMLAKRAAGEDAKVIEGETIPLENSEGEKPRETKRKARRDVVIDVGKDEDEENT